MANIRGKPMWMICPECCSLDSFEEPQILACGHVFRWLKEGIFPKFVNALTLDEKWEATSIELRLWARAEWPGGTTEVQGPVADPLKVPIPGLPTLHFRRETGTSVLKVGDSSEVVPHSWSIPPRRR